MKKISGYVSVFMHNSWLSRGKTTIAPSAVWTQISSDSEVKAGHSRTESAEVRRRAQKQSQYARLLTQVTSGGVQMNFCSLFHHQLHNKLKSFGILGIITPPYPKNEANFISRGQPAVFKKTFTFSCRAYLVLKAKHFCTMKHTE